MKFVRKSCNDKRQADTVLDEFLFIDTSILVSPFSVPSDFPLLFSPFLPPSLQVPIGTYPSPMHTFERKA